MLRPGAVPLVLAALPLSLAACGGDDDATVATISATAARPEIDARLDPDDIVITDEDLDGDGLASTDATGDGDPTAGQHGDDGDGPGSDGSVDGEGADPGEGTADPADQGDTGSGDDAADQGDTDVDFTTSEDVPDDWPPGVPAPTGLLEPASTVFEDGSEYTIVVTGVPTVEATTYVATYLDDVRSAGFRTTTVVDDGDQIFSFAAEGDGWFLSAAASGVGGTEEIVVALTRES